MAGRPSSSAGRTLMSERLKAILRAARTTCRRRGQPSGELGRRGTRELTLEAERQKGRRSVGRLRVGRCDGELLLARARGQRQQERQLDAGLQELEDKASRAPARLERRCRAGRGRGRAPSRAIDRGDMLRPPAEHPTRVSASACRNASPYASAAARRATPAGPPSCRYRDVEQNELHTDPASTGRQVARLSKRWRGRTAREGECRGRPTKYSSRARRAARRRWLPCVLLPPSTALPPSSSQLLRPQTVTSSCDRPLTSSPVAQVSSRELPIPPNRTARPPVRSARRARLRLCLAPSAVPSLTRWPRRSARGSRTV